MFQIKPLSPKQREFCKNTISPNTFYMLVGDALVSKESLSVVRMGDGERHFMIDDIEPGELVRPFPNFNSEWLRQLGCEGITCRELRKRLRLAARYCDYFAPSISGIQHRDFNLYYLFPSPDRYVDNFFVNAWTEEMKIALFKQAGHVLLIHNNAHTADSLQLRLQGAGIAKVHFIKLTRWQETEDVIQKAKTIDAPLVLISSGPAGKYIGPEIAAQGSSVCLDLGNAADHWVPQSLPINRPAAEKFHAEWMKGLEIGMSK